MADQKITVDCFGVASVSVSNIPSDVSCKYMARQKAILNKELGEFDIVPDEPLNIDEVIQSYKDDCGIEQVRRMMARGEDVSQFADNDGKYVDASEVSTELVDSKRMIAKQQDVINAICKSLGIDGLNPDNFEDAIKTAIEKQTNNSEVLNNG